MGADSVVRSLARKGLQIVGLPTDGSSAPTSAGGCGSGCRCDCRSGGACACGKASSSSTAGAAGAAASSSGCTCPSSCPCGCQSGGACSCSKASTSSAAIGAAADASGGLPPPLMGTPAEPYANPRHPDARPDSASPILGEAPCGVVWKWFVGSFACSLLNSANSTPKAAHPPPPCTPCPPAAGNPLEQYANPSPQWREAAGAAAAALEQADRSLPASVSPSSATSAGGCGCPAACGRGCRSGGTCTCGKASSSGEGVTSAPTSASASGSGCSCPSNCPCGCRSGGPCSCGGASASASASGSGSGDARTAAAAAGSDGATAGLGASPRVQPLLRRLHSFMEQHVYPAGEHPGASALW